jgi:hypothetical protein
LWSFWSASEVRRDTGRPDVILDAKWIKMTNEALKQKQTLIWEGLSPFNLSAGVLYRTPSTPPFPHSGCTECSTPCRLGGERLHQWVTMRQRHCKTEDDGWKSPFELKEDLYRWNFELKVKRW